MGYKLSYSSYSQICSLFRKLFEYYIDNYKLIRNPFQSQAMRGSKAMQRFAEGRLAFTYESFQNIIERVREEYDYEKACYVECLMLLYYEGVYNAEEIINIKNSDVDAKTHTLKLPGRTLRLTDRCFELLQYVHSLTTMPNIRGDYDVVNYRNGYFKYIVRKKESEEFDDREPLEISRMLNRNIIKFVKNKFNVNINYKTLYYLGLYDYIVKQVGKDKAKQLIESNREANNLNELKDIVMSYNIPIESISLIKRDLHDYI